MKHNNIIYALIGLFSFVLYGLRDFCRANSHVVCFANAVPGSVPRFEGTQPYRRLEAAFETRHLLARQGTAADQLLVGTASAMPIGWLDTTGAIGDRVSLELLSNNSRSAVLVAGGEIAAGVRVFAAAGGKVTELPAGAGDYWCVGTSLTGAGADTQHVAVDTCHPFLVTVSG